MKKMNLFQGIQKRCDARILPHPKNRQRSNKKIPHIIYHLDQMEKGA